MEHRNEMNFDHTIHSHFTSAICNSGGNLKKSVTYRDIYDPFAEPKRIDPSTPEGKKKIRDAIKRLDGNI